MNTKNIVGKRGGDVTIKTVNNSGDGSVNEIGLLLDLQNLKNTIKVDTVHSGGHGGGSLIGTKGDSDITVGQYILDGKNTKDTWGKKGSSQNINIGTIQSSGKG